MRKAEIRRERERLGERQVGVHDVVLRDVSDLPTDFITALRRGAGTVAFYGSPRQTLTFFGAGNADFGWVYEQLRDTTQDWPRRFAHSPNATHNVEAALARSDVWAPLSSRPAWASFVRQTLSLARRNSAVMRGNERYFLALAWQAPAMALLLVVVLGLHNLTGDVNANPRGLLSFTAVAALAIGLINACREIVKEIGVYRREQTVGMSIGAYLAAKLAFLAGLSLAQSLLLAVVMFGQDGLIDGLIIPSRLGEVVLILFLSILCAVAGGLAISAIVKSDSTALVMAPVILVSQLLLTGAFLDVENKPVLAPAAYLTPSYWSFSALASTNDLERLESICGSKADAIPSATPKAPLPPVCGDRWDHSSGTLRGNLTMLVLLTLVYAGAALAVLRRQDSFGRSA